MMKLTISFFLLFLKVSAAAEQTCDAKSTQCPDEVAALQTTLHKHAVVPISLPSVGEKLRMDRLKAEQLTDTILEEEFKDVKGMGSVLAVQSTDCTWKECGKFDWDEPKEFLEQANIIAEYVGCSKKWKGDDTCLAIIAAYKATKRLIEEYRSGNIPAPLFVNFAVSNFGEHNSWPKDSVKDVNQKTMPPSATVVDPVGLMPYSLCNIIRTVLTQSPNQFGTGTCGWVASLGVMSLKAPAKTLKMAVRLMWTGKPVPAIKPPCEYILKEEFPGLVPFMDDEGKWIPVAPPSTEETRGGNAGDAAASMGNPSNPFGLVGMWIHSLISAYNQDNPQCFSQGPAHDSHPQEYSCDDPKKPQQIIYPGMKSADLGGWEMWDDLEGQSTEAGLWVCQHVIDPVGASCHTIGSDEDAFTEELLETICKAAAAIVFVESDRFADVFDDGVEPEYSPDHAIAVDYCDEDHIFLWSWGMVKKVTKKRALGLEDGETYTVKEGVANPSFIFTAIVADQVTFAQLA